MTTWTEWFADLDGRLEGSIGGRLPEVNELLRGTTLFLDRLVESAAQSHFLAASLLYSQGWKAAWLPAALPNIFGGFKVAVSLAVIGAVIGEYVAAERGLGYLQLQANSLFDTTLNFATVVTISGLGVMLYFIIDTIEARVTYKRDAAK